MSSPSSSSSSLARWLAPVALVLCAIAVFVIVTDNSGGGSSGATTTQERTGGKEGAAAASGRAKRTSRRSARRYVVKPGDTLSAISAKTGVSLARLQQLNPQLDAQSLQTGQKVKLRP